MADELSVLLRRRLQLRAVGIPPAQRPHKVLFSPVADLRRGKSRPDQFVYRRMIPLLRLPNLHDLCSSPVSRAGRSRRRSTAPSTHRMPRPTQGLMGS